MYFCTHILRNVFVAQLVEQLTLNQWVQGSNPCEDTTKEKHLYFASAFLFSGNINVLNYKSTLSTTPHLLKLS